MHGSTIKILIYSRNIGLSGATPEGFITREEFRDIGARDRDDNAAGIAETLRKEIWSTDPGHILRDRAPDRATHIECFVCPNLKCQVFVPKVCLLCSECRCCYVYCDTE